MTTTTPPTPPEPTTPLLFPQGEHPADPDATTAPLYGETEVDEVFLTEVVRQLNHIHRHRGLQTARDFGEFLLGTFFGGDIRAFRAKGKKHASLRALADRDDLDVSYSTLWYSIAVLEQLRELPSDIGGALPMSHHRLLLPVQDDKLKTELARQAVEQGLTKRDLAARIKALQEQAEPTGRGKPGRPALPAWAKGLGSARRSFEAAASHDITDADVAHHGKDLLESRLEEVAATMAVLAGLQAKLVAALQKVG